MKRFRAGESLAVSLRPTRKVQRARTKLLGVLIPLSLTDAPRVSRSYQGLHPKFNDYVGGDASPHRYRFPLDDLETVKKLVPPSDFLKTPDTLRLPISPGYRVSRETMLLSFLGSLYQNL